MYNGENLSDFFKRIMVAVVGIPFAICVVFLGGYFFLAVVLIISSITLYEFYKLAEKKNIHPHKISGIFIGILIILLFYYNSFFEIAQWLIVLFILFMLFIMILELWSHKPNALSNISTSIAGIIYIPLSFACMLNIREFYHLRAILHLPDIFLKMYAIPQYIYLTSSEACTWFLMSIFFSIWICDSAAYFAGMALGKHKLMPRISPKKTWEGAIAGFIGGIIGFCVSTMLFLPKFPLVHSIILGAIVGTIGQIGDLAESQLKRDVNVKDSSTLIPGHGGMLDRFDSILFVIPVIYFYLMFMPLW
jgi:phosphatidate cytidylyltransferase